MDDPAVEEKLGLIGNLSDTMLSVYRNAEEDSCYIALPEGVMGNSLAEILSRTNEAQMFVTVWLGILELSTGKLIAANAGHEFPALRQPGKPFELYKDRHGFVIGGTERMIDALNTNPDATPQEILKNVRTSVDGFVKDAEQFDDLTIPFGGYSSCLAKQNPGYRNRFRIIGNREYWFSAKNGWCFRRSIFMRTPSAIISKGMAL